MSIYNDSRDFQETYSVLQSWPDIEPPKTFRSPNVDYFALIKNEAAEAIVQSKRDNARRADYQRIKNLKKAERSRIEELIIEEIKAEKTFGCTKTNHFSLECFVLEKK